MILSYLRTIILYLILILVIRLMGKRQIGEMEPAEFVVTMLVANLAAIPMQDGGIPLLTGLIPILTVLGVELVLSFLMLRSGWLRRLFCGQPVLLIDEGKLLQGNLRLTRVTLEELLGKLREKDILDLSQVQYAILETDGEVSVFPYARFQPPCARDLGVEARENAMPMVVVEDGRVLEENLVKSGKTQEWVLETLAGHGSNLQSTLILTVDATGKSLFIGKEGL